jgi:hypothetical protein
MHTFKATSPPLARLLEPLQWERSALSSPGRDTRTEEGEEARSKVSTFIAREWIHITLAAEAYKLHVQMSAGRQEEEGPISTSGDSTSDRFDGL